MKILIIIGALIYSSLVGAVAPYGVKGQSQTLPIYANVNQMPYNQVTKLTGINSLFETGNENLLSNPNIEGLATSGVANGWTNSAGTPTLTTTAGEFTSGRQAQKIVLSSQVLNYSQAVTTTSGIQKQGYARFTYRVPSAIADFQVCIDVDAVNQTCVPTVNLILDDNYHSIDVPLLFGSTSVKVYYKTTASVSGTVYIDATGVYQGLYGASQVLLDNTFSAKISAAGVVSDENQDFISGNCTPSSAVYPCTINPGFFTVPPNCTAIINNTPGAARTVALSSVTATTVTTATFNSASAAGVDHILMCQKQGADYKTSSVGAYTQASSDFTWQNYTPTFNNITTSPANSQCKFARDGGDMLIRCSFTVSTAAAATFSMSIPAGYAIDATRITEQNTSASPGQAIGEYAQNSANMGYIVTAVGTSTGLLYSTNGATGLTPVNASTSFSTTQLTTFKSIRIPIVGWSAGVMVGVFAGIPYAPGYNGRVDTFQVAYGTTNATTVCSVTPCSFLDQIGTAVSSIALGAAGVYTLNTTRTYLKLMCTYAGAISGAATATSGANYCTNCNALTFNTFSSGATKANSFGNLSCTGTY